MAIQLSSLIYHILFSLSHFETLKVSKHKLFYCLLTLVVTIQFICIYFMTILRLNITLTSCSFILLFMFHSCYYPLKWVRTLLVSLFSPSFSSMRFVVNWNFIETSLASLLNHNISINSCYCTLSHRLLYF